MPADRSPLVWTRARGKNAQVEPYVAARIVGRTADGDVRIALENGAAPQQISEADTVLRNPPGTRPDNCQLLHLNEACVLENVSMRYLEGQIYTWTSHVLTAVNPYEPLPLYSEKLAAELPLMNSRDLPPHAFSIAELAVRKVVRGSQAIVVSGESGAGKTTNMAHVMAYLTRRSRNSGQADSALGAGLGTLLLQSNPVLEAFGNAQTVRNHNSSRFGKFIKVTYDASGTRMTGMFLQTYLLEKVRVVAPGAAERTYHVFYAMLDGASAAEVKHWGIRSQKDHQLTSGAAGTDAGAGNGSAETYSELRAAMSVLTVRQEEQVDLLGIVAAILHLRDVRFQPLEDEVGCRAIGSASLAAASKLLGCPGIALRLVQRVITSGRQEPVTVALSAAQASSARDGLCKALYVATFNHICSRFNAAAVTLGHSLRMDPHSSGRKPGRTPGEDGMATPSSGLKSSPSLAGLRRTPERPQDAGAEPLRTPAPPVESAAFIGLLDMFGFECFDINSFEQLCINLANERLQGYFQHCVFVAEEEVHRLEGVPWPSDLEYHDNRGCITLVEKSILPLLDEACGLQSTSEENFFLRVHEACSRDQFFTAPRRKHLLEQEGFIVRHFAGDVCYCSAAAANTLSAKNRDRNNVAMGDTWLNKNADRLLPELFTELASSSSPLITTMFRRQPGQDEPGSGGRLNTVARRFTSELDSLLKDLSQTHTLFIRCIKPNEKAAPKLLDRASCLAQLRCLGMTDVVRLMHHAYPTRIPYSDLHGRYAKGMPPVLAGLSPKDFCEAVALMCDVSLDDMKLGTNRLFLRGGKGMFLEELADMDIDEAMPLLLAKIQEMNTRRDAGQKVARAVWTHHLRMTHQRKRLAATTVLRCWRGARDRKNTLTLLAERRKAREEQEKKAASRLAAQQAAAAAQKAKFDAALASVPGSSTATATPSESSYVSARDDETTASSEKNPSRAEPALSTQPAGAPAEAALWTSLGIAPLCAAQLRAVRALRQRLGEHLVENTSEIATSPTSEKSGVPARRRLHPAPGNAKVPAGLPPPSWMTGFPAQTANKYDVILTRDARDGTLGIDLDQFAGKPTVAIVVPGGPAERDGSVKVGDVVLAVDGIACSTISEVITILTSPKVCAKSQLTVTIMRMPTIIVKEDFLLVRSRSSASAADGLGNLSGGSSNQSGDHGASGPLASLREWTPCVCTLHSDRRLSVVERNLGVDIILDLRAALSVQLVLLSTAEQKELSCLQIRLSDGILEFCSAGMEQSSTALERWQQPLEEMLMLSLGSVNQGWLYDVSSPRLDFGMGGAQMMTYPRVFVDLNYRAQLRNLTENPRAHNSTTLGVVELGELHDIELVQLDTQLFASQRGEENTLALQITDADHSAYLTSARNDDVCAWHKYLKEAHQEALVRLVQYTGMILIDGWLEYQGDEDEWAPGFFMLTIGGGLQCFEKVVTEPARSTPIETIPLTNITGAVRSKGIDYYDWCMDIRTTDLDYIRVRPPRQSEMTRWLATINLYCTPPPKRKPDKPRRQSVDSASLSHSLRPGRPSGTDKAPPSPRRGSAVPAASNLLPSARPAPPNNPRDSPSRPGAATERRSAAEELLPRVSQALEQGDDVILRLAASSTGNTSGNTSGSNSGHASGYTSRDEPRPSGRPGLLVVPSDAQQHPGLLRGWSHETSSSSGTPQQQQPTMTKRRSLSFGRRRSIAKEAPTAAPKPQSSRGGRLQVSQPAAAEAIGGANSNGATVYQPAPPTSKLTARRPSFGRRRSTSQLQAQSESSGEMSRASTLETPRGSPYKAAETAGAAGGEQTTRQPFRAVRALSFSRRRKPPLAEPGVVTKSGSEGSGDSPSPVADKSGAFSENTTQEAETYKPSRSASFSRKMVRRAASFGTRRRNTNSFSDV